MRDSEMDLNDRLKKLVTKLRRKASIERKKVNNDSSHYEGMCKGLWLAYDEAASEIKKLL